MGYPVIENPVTGERGTVRQAADSDSSPLVADLYARPGDPVVGDHIHPTSTETFTVVRGTLGIRLDGLESRAEAGTRVVVPTATPDEWWNAGDDTAWVIVEGDPGRRFEAMIRNLFGLLFAALAPVARLRGLRGSYPHHTHHTGENVDELEELPPPEIAALIPAP